MQLPAHGGERKLKAGLLSHEELERDPAVRHGSGGQDTSCLHPCHLLPSVLEQNPTIYAGKSFFEEADLAWPRSPELCRMLSPRSGHVCCSLLRNMQLTGCKDRDMGARRGCCASATPHRASHVQKQLCLVKLLRCIRRVIKQPNPVINFNDM